MNYFFQKERIFTKEKFLNVKFFTFVLLFSISIILTPFLLKEIEYYFQPIPPLNLKGYFSAIFLDVRQGDSVIIKSSDGHYLLYDGGKSGTQYSRFDAGEEVVVPFLKKYHINTLDYLICSHAHDDHLGGLVAVLRSNIKIKKVMDNGEFYISKSYKNYNKLIKKKKLNYQIARTNDKFEVGNIKFIVLHPSSVKKGDPNNNSVSIKGKYKNFSLLLSGDAEKESETKMVKLFGKNLKSLLLKAPHHGSDTSSSDEFLSAVSPKIIVISCGLNNKYGHPAPETLKKYVRRGIKFFRTDLQGTIFAITDGKKILIGREKR